MIRIADCTLICVDCYNYAGAIKSIRNCMSKCEFDRVVFLTDIYIDEDGIEVIQIPRINSKEGYSEFICRELYRYFDASFCLIVQHDGTILDESQWDEKYRLYDVVGASWGYTDGRDNGNGGFSWRSHKVQKALATDPFIQIISPEDEILGRLYRHYLEVNYGVKFAPPEICNKFAYELNAPTNPTFGHHAYFHPPFKKHIVLKRTAALGDLIMLCPAIEYYCENEYQVVIDTIPEFMQIFHRYKYPIKHVSEMDSRIVPEKMINFDLGYEMHPTKRVIDSYISLTGESIEPSNAKLYFDVDPSAKLFNKLILIHADSTGMAYRDQHGINWQIVVAYLLKMGFHVFQIGKRLKDEVAPYLNTPTIETMMFFIKTADLLIGIDSSPLQLAVALGIPAIGLFGSVNPDLRYLSSEKLITLHTYCPSSKDRFCYHEGITGSTTGIECEFDKEVPPCTVFSEFEIIKSANKLLNI